MALAANALVSSIQNVRAHVLRDSTDASADDRLELLANAFSTAIHRYTGREFKPTANATARKFRYRGAGVLALSPYELRTLTSIVLHTDLPADSQETLEAADADSDAEYRLEPRNKSPESTYLWVVLPKLSLSSERAREGAEVTITGDWGAGVIPADVELACLIAIAQGFRNPEDFSSRSLGEFGFVEATEAVSLDRTTSLPPASRALLTAYRRPIQAA